MGYSRQLCKPEIKWLAREKQTHLDVTAMFIYSHANTPLGQSERAYYLSYSTFTDIFSYVFIWHLASGSGDLNPWIPVAVQ